MKRYIIAFFVILMIVPFAHGLARAERGGAGYRLVVFPFRGPGGMIVRNAVVERLQPHFAFIHKAGGAQAKAPARTARRVKADALVTGAVRCPGKACVVEVVISKRSGKLWSKGRKRCSSATLGPSAAELVSNLLHKLHLSGPPRQAEDEEVIFGTEEEEEGIYIPPVSEPEEGDVDLVRDPDFGDTSHDNDYDEDDEPYDDEEEPESDDEDDDGRRGKRGHNFDAIEFYFNTDLTIRRDICVDLDMVDFIGNECDRKNPYWDDRAYAVGPFASLGARLAIFPGAFVNRRKGYSHLGLYFEYGRSVSLSSKRVFESSEEPPPGEDPEEFDVFVDTVQQDFKVGLVYRIPMPFRSPTGPQLRLMFGAGYYEFSFDHTDWPDDDDVSSRFRDSNPYLAAFSYLSIDSGLELRIPVRGIAFPFLSVLYRAALRAGQANRIYGLDSTIHGVNAELGVRLEPGAGVRFILAADLIWYLSTFDGEFTPEDEAERQLWDTDAFPGDNASDFIIRLRMGFGWSY